MVASPLPVPKPKEYYTKRAAKLEEFRDRYPEDNEGFIWAFMTLTDQKLGVIRAGETGVKNKHIWPEMPSYDLVSRYKQDLNLCNLFLKDIFKKRSDMEGPKAYDKWNVHMEYHVQYTGGNSISVRYKVEFDKYRQFDDESWSNRKNKRELFEQHKLAFERMETMKTINIDAVFAGIERMKQGLPPKGTTTEIEEAQKFKLAASNKPLEIPIPQMSDEQIAEQIKAIEPNSFDGITGFGRNLQSDVAKAIQQISEYFIQHSARPAETLDRVEQIMQTNAEINPSTLLPAMPRNAFNRAAGRIFGVRLVKPEDMPFAQIVAMASDLPERADNDDKHYSHDLKIVDHAVKICTAYADIMDRAAKAFEADKDRLIQIDENKPLALGLASSAVPELFETRITELAVSVQFLNNQAGRFGQIGRTIGHTRNQLGRMAALSHTVQIPALDAIQAFNLYQLKRLSAFGRSVDDKVMEQLQINSQAAAEIPYSTGDVVLGNLDAARDRLNDTFATLSRQFKGDMDGQKELAREIGDETTQHLLGSASKPKP
jgi:hypothetical protein